MCTMCDLMTRKWAYEFPHRDSLHTHIRKKEELVALSKRRRPSSIAASSGHYRPLTSVRAWNFENVDQGGGRDRDKKWPIRPFIQTSSLQHCYYNAHKGDRYAARNRIRAIVPSDKPYSLVQMWYLSICIEGMLRQAPNCAAITFLQQSLD